MAAAQRLYDAATALQDEIDMFSQAPELQGSWADLLFRALRAHPAWQEMRYARKEWDKNHD